MSDGPNDHPKTAEPAVRSPDSEVSGTTGGVEIAAKSETEHVGDDWDVELRPCHWYNEEYKDCKSIKARFHQYFVHGASIDCQQWKTDFDNCLKYEKIKDEDARAKVLQSEKQRFKDRIGATIRNNTWSFRDSTPPEKWSSPLPDYVLEKQKGSLFHLYKDGTLPESGSCVVM